jgi:hypothetical protein
LIAAERLAVNISCKFRTRTSSSMYIYKTEGETGLPVCLFIPGTGDSSPCLNHWAVQCHAEGDMECPIDWGEEIAVL